MLVKITTQCQMGCSHCMEEAECQGEHMPLDLFDKVLSFVEKVYGGVKLIMISGGEPTEHPEILQILDRLKGWNAILLSNGLFMSTPLADEILKYDIAIQVYNDPRYYPKRVSIDHPKVLFANEINLLSPFGRARKNGLQGGRMSPLCFNLRSLVRSLRGFKEGIMALRMAQKMCSPAIDVKGNITAGECRFCYKIGTVESSFAVLSNNLLTMQCNSCGLENGLNTVQKKAIYG